MNHLLKLIHDYAEHILSYITAGMALFMALPLMQIGGAVLLIARLIVDLPPAYMRIKEWTNRSK